MAPIAPTSLLQTTAPTEVMRDKPFPRHMDTSPPSVATSHASPTPDATSGCYVGLLDCCCLTGPTPAWGIWTPLPPWCDPPLPTYPVRFLISPPSTCMHLLHTFSATSFGCFCFSSPSSGVWWSSLLEYYWSPTFCRYQRGGSTCKYTYTEARRRPDGGQTTVVAP